MAEEGKYPQLAWEPTSGAKNAEQVSKSKVDPYISSRRDIYANCIEPSQAKILVQSSLSKLNLTSGLPYLPEQGKFFRFGKRRRPSRVTGLFPLLSSTKLPLTKQSSQRESLPLVSGNKSFKYPTTFLRNSTATTNLAQVIPVNCNMDGEKESVAKEPEDKKLEPRKPCQCTSTADATCTYHDNITEESIDENSVRTVSKLINVLPAHASESTNMTEETVPTAAKPHPEQTCQQIPDIKVDHVMETHNVKKKFSIIKVIKVLPTDDTSDDTDTMDCQKEERKLKTPVNLKPRLSQEIQYTPAANASCDVYHVPIVYNNKYNINITKLYPPLTKKKTRPPPVQPFLLDKPAQVFSVVKDKLLYQPIEAIDASSVYNLFNFVCDPIRRYQVDKIVELMNLVPLKLPKPITWKKFFDCMLHPLLLQMMGSILACKLALDEGWAINIGGGFSHYTTNTGGGLAVYDDILVCLALVSEFPNVKHILVINLDAYQSPCYKYLTAVLCKVTIIDFYSQPIQEDHGYSKIVNRDIKYMGYMVSKEEGTSSFDYLSRFKQVVKEFLDSAYIQPSLCIYVAGTTILADNPNTRMKFTHEGVVKRDHTMFQLMKHYNIPIAYLMGGGYQPYDVKATTLSIINLLENNMLNKKLGGKGFC